MSRPPLGTAQLSREGVELLNLERRLVQLLVGLIVILLYFVILLLALSIYLQVLVDVERVRRVDVVRPVLLKLVLHIGLL